MSLPIERRSGQSDNNFSARMVKHVGLEEFQRLTELGHGLDQHTGFKGLRMEYEIAMWNSFKYGRKLGGKIQRGNMYEQVPMDLREYRGTMYALPFTDPSINGLDQRVLLVLPTEQNVEIALIGPRAVGGSKAIAGFQERFLPSQEPYLHTPWNLATDESPLQKFRETQAAFYAQVHSKIEETDHVSFLGHATTIAQEWKNMQ
jgi:hypothetical protein